MMVKTNVCVLICQSCWIFFFFFNKVMKVGLSCIFLCKLLAHFVPFCVYYQTFVRYDKGLYLGRFWIKHFIKYIEMTLGHILANFSYNGLHSLCANRWCHGRPTGSQQRETSSYTNKSTGTVVLSFLKSVYASGMHSCSPPPASMSDVFNICKLLKYASSCFKLFSFAQVFAVNMRFLK